MRPKSKENYVVLDWKKIYVSLLSKVRSVWLLHFSTGQEDLTFQNRLISKPKRAKFSAFRKKKKKVLYILHAIFNVCDHTITAQKMPVLKMGFHCVYLKISQNANSEAKNRPKYPETHIFFYILSQTNYHWRFSFFADLSHWIVSK